MTDCSPFPTLEASSLSACGTGFWGSFVNTIGCLDPLNIFSMSPRFMVSSALSPGFWNLADLRKDERGGKKKMVRWREFLF